MSLSEIVYESKEFSRTAEISIKQKKLMTPAYFPAISSYGTKYSFQALSHLLTVYSYPRLLISAYDIQFFEEKEQLLREISEYSKRCFVFLDSGVYESSWTADSKWTYDLYRKIASHVDFDFYTSFDILPCAKDTTEEFTKRTFEMILASYRLSNKVGFIPVLHGLEPDQLLSLVKKFVKKYPNLCGIIAVPERDCGQDIVEKARTIIKIRKLLDKSNSRTILHILGCGNPISLVIFSYCGADLFDSLDWTKCIIDPHSLITNDFSHLELINCDCSICSGVERNYAEKVLLHNLLFYQDYMLQIQSLIRKNQIFDFICEHVGQRIIRKIVNQKI